MSELDADERDIAGAVILVFNGDKRRPERYGVIPGVTPQRDGRVGLMPGEFIECTDELLARLNRPLGPQARSDFAEFIAGIYNANLKEPRWTVCLHPGGSIESYADTHEDVQSESEPDDTAGEPVIEYEDAESAPSAEEEETQ